VRVLPSEMVESMQVPIQGLNFVHILLLGLWVFRVALRRGLDNIMEFFFVWLLNSVLSGERIHLEEVNVSEDEDQLSSSVRIDRVLEAKREALSHAFSSERVPEVKRETLSRASSAADDDIVYEFQRGQNRDVPYCSARLGLHKVYVVRKGYHPGIYGSWPDCELQVKGFSGAEFKSFKHMIEAENWMRYR
jgi:hypothetical protein